MFLLMYLLNRLRLVAWVYIPVQWLVLIVAGILLVVRFGLKRLTS
jgi:hypothetical protein